MGQGCSAGGGCCSCWGDRRGSVVLNDALQEKLLDEDHKLTATDESMDLGKASGSGGALGGSSDGASSPGLGVSSDDKATWTRTASSLEYDAMMNIEQSYQSSIKEDDREEDSEDEDEDDDERTTANANEPNRRRVTSTSNSYTTHGWDLDEADTVHSQLTNADSAVGDDVEDRDDAGDAPDQALTTSSYSDGGVLGAVRSESTSWTTNETTRTHRLVSDVSLRSTGGRDDSYASSHEPTSENEDDKGPRGGQRGSAVQRMSSSQVFDDEDDPTTFARRSHDGGRRGLMASDGDEDAGSGGFGSDDSSLRSFRQSETSFAESQRVLAEAATADSSPKKTNSRSKRGKRSPRSKRR